MPELNDPETREIVAHAANPLAPLTHGQVGQAIMDNTPLLESEDRELYQRLCNAILEELKPETVLDYFDVNDVVFKAFEEHRYKAAAAAMLETARQKAWKGLKRPKEVREDHLDKASLQNLEQLSRLDDNAGRTRRSIQREIRARINERKMASSPPIAPDDPRSD
jgi:hypothetical protein